MSTIRVVNVQHTDATEPNIVLESDGTTTFASGITISGGTNLTVSGTAEFASGTVSTPGITFIDDNNTGIYEPAADTVAITTSGTERLRIDDLGNVGIGVTNAAQRLVVGSASNTVLRIDNADDSTAKLYFHNSGSTDMDISVTNAEMSFTSGGSNERMRIDSSGRLLVGTTSTIGVGNANAGIQSAGTTISRFSGAVFADSTNGAVLALGKSRSATVGSNTIVQDDDILGQIRFAGDDGTDLNSVGASILARVDGTPGENDMPGALVFSTTADGTSQTTERMRITSTGQMRLAGAGITFNGDTATTNELDDYEEGTFTPTISSGYTSPTYNHQVGYYVKVGKIVRVHLRVGLSGGTATSADIEISGLPFTSANLTSHYTTCTYYMNAGSGTIGNALKPLVFPNQNRVQIYEQTATSVNAVAGTTLGNTFDILLSVVYETT